MRHQLLLADDSVTIQHVIESTFADEPVDVTAVGDGAAAIASLDADPPDIVLADIGMPGRDGYEVALHVRHTPGLAHIPVILLTGAFDPVDHARARDAGCAGVLVKPFDPQMLIARVRQLLSGRRAVDAAPPAPAASRPEDAVGGEPGAERPPAPGADAQPSAGLPTPSADMRAAEVDDYFARLDRAFAKLQAAAPALNALGDETADGAGGDSAAQLAAVPPDFARDLTPGVAAPSSPSTQVRAPEPSLGDAFAALLAIEQGQPVPDGAAGWVPLVSADLVAQIAHRVSREITERVVREIAPEIVSQVAERVVHEELARVKTPPG
jgi:CheY-like chemotaxis protein